MAKTRESLRVRVSQATGRRRKKPTNPVERAFEDVKQLVSDTGERLLSRSGKSDATPKKSKAATKSKAAAKQASPTKTAGTRKRGGQQRQAATKQAGAARIRKGQQRQAATKKAARARGVKTS